LTNKPQRDEISRCSRFSWGCRGNAGPVRNRAAVSGAGKAGTFKEAVDRHGGIRNGRPPAPSQAGLRNGPVHISRTDDHHRKAAKARAEFLIVKLANDVTITDPSATPTSPGPRAAKDLTQAHSSRQICTQALH